MNLTWALDAIFFLNLRPLVGFCSICLVSFRVSCFCSRASAIILVISGGKTYHDLPCLFPKNDSLYRCVDTYTCREYFSDFQPTRVEPDRPKATSLKHWDDAVGSPAHHSTESFVKSFHFHPSVKVHGSFKPLGLRFGQRKRRRPLVPRCSVARDICHGVFSHASLFAVCLPPLVGVLYIELRPRNRCSWLLTAVVFNTKAYQTHRRSQVLPTGPDYTIESRQKQPVRESHHLLFLHNDLSKAQLEHIHPLNPDRINKPAHHIAKKYKHS